ncbi:S-layer homology domain-containing protein [Deinococcus sp. YIM 134068]|uniref:S-layer homology domain-containing protein n=1 Tax=Deinococcus lichenicola TaxID=3118910 RepID=UPI002F93757C
MKKSLFVLTAALSFGFAAAQTTTPAAPATPATPAATPAAAPAPTQVPTLTDVPAGHWAKDAIDRLVSQGIILGYPDGTYRGAQNLTRYEAAVILARLLDQVRTGQTDTSTLSPETLTSLQNAIQELAADLTALGVRVSDLEENAVNRDDFSRLEARVEELAAASGDAAAITQLQTQIAELTARADDYDALRADIDDNASSIAALNDLTVLLNQDILNLQDRVSAVESAQADFVQRADFDNLAGRVGTIDTRVTTLENAPRFTVSGTINAQYGDLSLTSGSTNFDVDRLTRQTFADGVFTSGVNCPDGRYAASGNAVSCVDTTIGPFTGDSGIDFGIRASNLITANGLVVVNNAAVNFGVNNEFGAGPGNFGGDVLVTLGSASADGAIAGNRFDVRYEAYNSKFKFNDYLFANDNDTEEAIQKRGVVINVATNPNEVALAPVFTVVAGNARTNRVDSNTGVVLPNVLSTQYYGVRATINPFGVGPVGLSFAQNDGNRTAFGLDYNVGFGTRNAEGNAPFNVTGAYVASIPQSAANFVTGPNGSFQNAFEGRDQAFFTDARADFGIARAAANFRAIDGDYAAGVAGMSGNDSLYYYGQGANGYKSSAPYIADQVGFGAGVGTTLGPVALAAFGDSYVPYLSTSTVGRNTSFGVSAGARLGALSLVGFFNRASLGDEVIHADLNYKGPGGNGFLYNSTTPYMNVADVPFAFSSTFGARLQHNGSVDNALIRGLSFTGTYARFYEDELGVNDFQAYAGYTGTFFGVRVEPFARYHLLVTPNDALVTDTGTAQTVATYNTVKYGVRLSTAPLNGVIFQPSAFLNFANRITNAGRQVQVAGTSTTELFGQTGLTFNQFLAPNLKTSIGYAYYQGFNVASSLVASSASAATATYSAASDRIYASPFSSGTTPFAGDNFGANSGRAQGVFAQVDWNGLSANYGVFYHDDFRPTVTTGATPYTNTGRTIAQGFKVSYTFKF